MQNKDNFEIEYINPRGKEYYEALYREHNKNNPDCLMHYEELTIEEIQKKYDIKINPPDFP